MSILDDMPFHLARIQSIAANLKLGNILPTIYSDSINGFGYASALFYPDLWLYIPAISFLSGLELIRAYQVFLVLITVITAISMYHSTRRMLTNLDIGHYYHFSPCRFLTVEQQLSILATIVYITFPYRLINVYFRGALGEVLSFVFLPVIACGLTEIYCDRKKRWHILALGMTGLIYSHIISSLMAVICILLAMLINFRQSWQQRHALLKAVLLTACLSAAFILPLIEQMQSNQFYYNTKNPFGSLADQAIKVGVSHSSLSLLMVHFIAISLAYYCHYKLKQRQWYPRIALMTFITLYLSIMTTSLFPWDILAEIPLLKYIQFPWRLFSLVTYTFSILSALVFLHLLSKKSSFWYFSLVTIIIASGFILTNIMMQSSAPYAQPVTYRPPAISVGRAEYLPAKVKISSIARRETIPLALEGKLTIEQYSKSGNKIELKFDNASSILTIEFPVIFYKGYKAYLNRSPLPVSESSNGLIETTIQNTGSGHIVILYEHTRVYLLAYLISFMTAVYMVYRYFFRSETESLKKL